MRNNRGVTLVELLVVVSVIGILVVALGFSFRGWIGNYRVESTVKQIYADMMDARGRAMRRNMSYFVDFPSKTTYRVIEDTNGNNAVNVGAGDTVLPTFPKTLQYPIPAALVGTVLTFDKRGLIYSPTPPALIDPLNPIAINLDTSAYTSVTPDYNCIVLSQSRINIGLMAGGACNAK